MKEENKIAITNILKQYPDIALGYAFGSFGRGAENALSDVDVAVVFKDDISKEKRDSDLSKVAAELERVFNKRGDVIEINLPITNPLLYHRAVLQGVPLVVRDRKKKAFFERMILREYEDTRSLRQIYQAVIINKIKNYVTN